MASVLALALSSVGAAEPTAIESEGIHVAFSLAGAAGAAPTAGQDGHFAFTLATGPKATPLRGAHPAAWLMRRTGDAPPDARACRAAAAGFIANTALAAPALDLNAFYVLSLADTAQISVIDPRSGFGGSRLIGLATLDAPGSDWAVSRARDLLAVAEPLADQVALVDAIDWTVKRKLALPGPDRLALSPDERLLLASYREGAVSGIAIFDLSQPEAPPVRLATGTGAADIAIDADSRFAFVTAADADRAWIIDLAAGQIAAAVPTGRHPVAVGYSALARRAYVAASDGTVTVLGTEPPGALASVTGPDGLAALKVAPGGRFVLAASPEGGQVAVLDTATDRIVQRLAVEGRPDAIGFTDHLAYLRRHGDEFLETLPLDQIGVEDRTPNVLNVGIGQLPLGAVRLAARAGSMAPVPGGDELLIANPGDEAIYDYHEGMAAPSGSFAAFGGEPRAIEVVDRSLREAASGSYRTVGRLPRAGTYDVVLYLDQPRLVHCFEVAIGGTEADGPPRVAGMVLGAAPVAGRPLPVTFRLVDPADGKSRSGVRDVRVVSFRVPGDDRSQSIARPDADGLYRAEIAVPDGGTYYLFVEAPSVALVPTAGRLIHVPRTEAANDIPRGKP
jgi:hypothetical protein